MDYLHNNRSIPPVPSGITSALSSLQGGFIPNIGQLDSSVQFFCRGLGYSVYFLEHSVVFVFRKRLPSDQSNEQDPASATLDGFDEQHQKIQVDVIQMDFINGGPAPIESSDPGQGRMHFLFGADPSNWQVDVPVFKKITYRDLWPGIDYVVRHSQGHLKTEFHLKPGAKVENIQWTYQGAKSVSVDSEGHLAVDAAQSDFRLTERVPESYRLHEDGNIPVVFRYDVSTVGGGYRCGFTMESDAKHTEGPLVIDPQLVLSSFLGGSNPDVAYGVAVDSSGYTYVTGDTYSFNFPVTPGVYQPTKSVGADVFVTKFNPAESLLVYSTFIGGSLNDTAYGIAIDGSGNAYVAGQTYSLDYPVTPGAFQTTNAGFGDGFVTKLNPTGSALVYSTFLGGSLREAIYGLTLDPAGNVYVAGQTYSSNFPVTPGAFQTTNAGFGDAFVTELNPAGSALLYSTFLGGSLTDVAYGITADASGNAYVVGQTNSSNFPVTPGAYQTTYGGFGDAFIVKVNPGGASLAYGTFLGGSLADVARGILVDSLGNAYVTGQTYSSTFPATPGAYQTTYGGGGDAFVTELNPTGSALLYSTFLGGSGTDIGYAISRDTLGAIYVAGQTSSSNFPVTPGAFQTTLGGFSDAFVTKFLPSGTSLAYSTYLGGSDIDVAYAVAVDPAIQAVVVGQTESANFPVTPGAYQTTYGGFGDAFLVKINALPAGATVNGVLTGATCQEISRTPAGAGYAPGYMYVEILFTVNVTYTIYGPTGTPIVSFPETAYFTETLLLYAPAGTVISCSLLSSLVTALFVDGQVCANIALCFLIQSTAAVQLLVPSLGYCPAVVCTPGPAMAQLPEAPNSVAESLSGSVPAPTEIACIVVDKVYDSCILSTALTNECYPIP